MAQTPEMVDIHCHILPDFDDGPGTKEESVAMAAFAARTTRVVFATPHLGIVNGLDAAVEIADRVASLQRLLDAENLALRVVPGAEVYPSGNLVRAVDCGAPLTLGGGRYLLLDTPMVSTPVDLRQLVFDLQTRNITPILAHPERCATIQRQPSILEDFLQAGALVQINSGSLLGRHGILARRTAMKFLRQRWAHFIASDAHSIRSRRSTLADAAAALRPEFGNETVAELMCENGRRVLEGETVPSNPAAYRPDGISGWFHRLAVRGDRRAA